MDLEDVYDDATLARIDEAGGAGRAPRPGSHRPMAGPVQRAGVALTIAAATAAGIREVFEAPERAPQEAIDPWVGGGTHPRVRFFWHPVPSLSVAEVLW